MGGYRFFQGTEELTAKRLTSVLEKNGAASLHLESAKSSKTMATIFSYAGGFLIGWPLGTAIGGGNPNWALAGVGAGLVCVGIPFNNSANKKTKEAVDVYNANARPLPPRFSKKRASASPATAWG